MNVFADVPDAVVGGAHEGFDAHIDGLVEHPDDGFVVFEADRLGPRLLVGKVVDRKKLVVAEQDFFHGASSLNGC
ncbi:MAG: hypothetical protein R2751_18535 [Bacteroidales bacterium]